MSILTGGGLFFQDFSKIAESLTSILKTTGSSGLSAPKAFKAENNEVVGGIGGDDAKT